MAIMKHPELQRLLELFRDDMPKAAPELVTMKTNWPPFPTVGKLLDQVYRDGLREGFAAGEKAGREKLLEEMRAYARKL